ncbi:MAG: diguanylate cyclase [Candidatus Schekmanbacteria bacterium]|nr:diguanylate cyclase [Candidatus Schekmanbacteria bacterium]
MQYSILLIDNDEKYLRHLKGLLTAEGYKATAADAASGQRELETGYFDLILIEPEEGSASILDFIQHNHPESLTIIITGRASVESAINALRNGAYDYLTKPIREEILMQAVKRACERVQLQHSLLEATRRLQLMVITDSLTDVYNQRYFQKRLSEEFDRNKRYAQPLSCIMIDVDSFKHLNDTYGHMEGDKVLKKIADTIKNSIRNSDFLARYGGDEFVLLLPQTNASRAYLLAERIQQAVASDFSQVTYKEYCTPTLSLGISSLPNPDIRDEQELVAMADKALYEAKRSGRNRIEICL